MPWKRIIIEGSKLREPAGTYCYLFYYMTNIEMRTIYVLLNDADKGKDCDVLFSSSDSNVNFNIVIQNVLVALVIFKVDVR